MGDRLSTNQRQILTALSQREWKRARLFDARTVRSLVNRGLAEPSSRLPWMLKHNLDDLTVRITEQGIRALTEGDDGHDD